MQVTDRDYDALDGADALVLLTEWLSYRAPNFAEIKKRLRGGAQAPLVVDARNIWRPSDVTERAFATSASASPSTSPRSTLRARWPPEAG